ncbi:MAG TPA: hypothetical protein VGQ96_01070, partial [Candidatus Eremiobacteraceae bacterium]|nr:hypothetical protein [Candidatus Eremiobacteraceae bacterium]
GDWLGLAKSDHARTRATRIMVLVVSLLALLFWLFAKTSLVGLNLIAYEGVAQFFPGVIFALIWRRASAAGVIAGIASGLTVLIYLAATQRATIGGVAVGFFALVVNVLVCVGVSLFSRTLRPVETAD